MANFIDPRRVRGPMRRNSSTGVPLMSCIALRMSFCATPATELDGVEQVGLAGRVRTDDCDKWPKVEAELAESLEAVYLDARDHRSEPNPVSTSIIHSGLRRNSPPIRDVR